MAEPRWTVLVVPHGQGKSKGFEVSRPVVRVFLASGLAALVVAAVFGFTTVSRYIDLTRLRNLDRQNQLLAKELEQTRSALAGLGDTLQRLSELDRRARVLAGLNPNSPEVQQAGIGGPAGEWGERDTLLAAGQQGQEALQMRLDVSTLVRRANLLARSFREASESLQAHNQRLAHTPSISPISLTAGWLTSRFALERIHPIHHDARPHEGIDISAPMGEPIMAPAGGVVTFAGEKAGYGKMIALDHGYGLVTRYAHCSKLIAQVGQRIKRNDVIGLVGNTGISTGPHLHYEVIVNGNHVDPLKHIFPETIVD